MASLKFTEAVAKIKREAATTAERRLSLKITRDIRELREESERVARRYLESIRPTVSTAKHLAQFAEYYFEAYKSAHVGTKSQHALF